MSFKKPFKAAPVELGSHYRSKHRDADKKSAIRLLTIAAAAGATVGAGSLAFSEDGRTRMLSAVKPFAVGAGIVRAREPQSRDFWSGCDDARAAGTAPIYSGEPGYHESVDGDGDGIACEPHR